MRIGIGLNLLAPDNGGVTNYVLTLLRNWREYAPEHPMVLFSFAQNEPLLETLPATARQHEIRLQTQEEALEHFDNIDVYFCPFGTLWPRPVRKPSTLTFHDLQERFHPEHFTERDLEERCFHYDWSLRMADSVIAISEFTRDMVVDIVGISRRKVRVVHHVPDELPSPRKPHAIEGWPGAQRFVFFPGNFWKHKNHLRLLEAMADERVASAGISLICTGSQLEREREWQDAIQRTGVAERVLHLGKVTRGEISWLYRNARALVFPSLFEGFGIPLLEAMSTGCPITCGLNTSQPDVARDAALYFNATEPRQIAAAIVRIDSDEALRVQLVGAGVRQRQNFTVGRLIDEHLSAFALAARRHAPWRAWWNERILLPRSQRLRMTLTPHEIRTAARLLSARTRLPRGYPHISA